MRNFKNFTKLEKLILKKLIENLDKGLFSDTKADESQLNYTYPLSFVTESKRKGKTLGDLDTQTLVYLITNNKSNIDLRIHSIFVLFHKINIEDEYPYKSLISKEEYVNEAVIPEIRHILFGLKIQLETTGEQNEADEGNRGNTLETNVVKAEVQKEEYPRSDRDADGKSTIIKNKPPRVF